MVIAAVAMSSCNMAGPDRHSNAESGTIDRWVDGDTIKLKDGTRVRLLLIDTPESVAPQEERNSQRGVSASEWVKEEFPAGMRVWLTYDVEKTDKYDRVLAYVWDEDPQDRAKDDAYVREHMLNARILASGNAHVLQVKPNGQSYIELFRKIEREAGSSTP